MTKDTQRVLLGDEAIAQGALDAGISGCYAYPGTPSTEIMEFIQASPQAAERDVHRDWSCNEKTAMEEALGMSFAGLRTLVCMKHVGLNVAADGFVNSAITGVHGGLVLTVADDPSMHSSQNEQDSRFYAEFAGVPLFEPGDQQEAYDLLREAFELSESLQTPVVVRLTTRLAHSRANVTVRPPLPQNEKRFPERARRFVLLPAIARREYAHLIDKQPKLLDASERSPVNIRRDGPDRSLGIIACGITRNYLNELFRDAPCPYPVLEIRQYPVPKKALRQLVEDCERVLVLEEGMPFLEQRLIGLLAEQTPFSGRLDGTLPRQGELNPDAVAVALGIDRTLANSATVGEVPLRPPRLCDGCPHILSYKALREALAETPDGRVFSDIGCYTLGALPPFEVIDTCVDMGASVSMAKGASDAGVRPAVAVIGDSTFTHSGMTPLLDCVWEKTPVTIFILDNSTTAMTGGQDSLGSGRFEEIVAGIGVEPEHILTIEPLPKHHEANVAALKREFEYAGVSVVIARRECIQTARRK